MSQNNCLIDNFTEHTRKTMMLHFYMVASADGTITPAEDSFLTLWAESLGLSDWMQGFKVDKSIEQRHQFFDEIKSKYFSPQNFNSLYERVYSFMILLRIAKADGEPSPKTFAMIEKMTLIYNMGMEATVACYEGDMERKMPEEVASAYKEAEISKETKQI